MRDGLYSLDQSCGAAEERVHSGGDDQPIHLAHAHDRSRIRYVIFLLVDRQRFARQRRLIDAEVVAIDQLQVGRDDIAELDHDNIAGHKGLCFDVTPFAAAQHSRMQREMLLQRLDFVIGFEFLPETDDRIQRQHEKDDDEVFPMPNDRREHRGDFDHPRDRPPQKRQEPLEWADVLFFDGIRTVLLEPARRFFLGQSMLDARMELGQRLLDRPGISWHLHTLGGICSGGVSLGSIGLALISLRSICLRSICLEHISFRRICGS